MPTSMHIPAAFTRGALADRDGLAVIGRTLHDLRGIRFGEGEGGNTGTGGGDADGTGDATGTGNPTGDANGGDAGDSGRDGADGDDTADADKLSDAGKQALDRMKAERNEARRTLRAFTDLGLTVDQIKSLKVAADEADPDKITATVRDQVTTEIRTAYAEKFRASAVRDVARDLGFIDPGDALALLPQAELAAVAVDENDDVDRPAVKTLLDALAKAKPHLIQTSSDWRTAGIGGIGSGPSRPDVAPGADRLRSAYATTPTK